MFIRSLFRSIIVSVLVIGAPTTPVAALPKRPLQPATPAVLYDSALGTLPEAQGFTPFVTFNGTSTAIYTNSATLINTTATITDYAGYFGDSGVVPAMDRQVGYAVRWTMQVLTETHLSPHRAGVSLIALSNDAQGLEIGFWTDRIWVQEDDNPGPIFTQAEGVTYATTSGLINYQLNVVTDTYQLWADGQAILSGAVRDYTPYTGTVDPYEIPNLIFIGDDTTSAQASFRLTYFAIDTAISGLSAANSSPTALGAPTYFTATISNGTNVTYTWDFGDQSPLSNLESPSHTYSTIGVYTAVVTATNSVNTLTAITPITITDIPLSGLSANNDSPSQLGAVTNFTATLNAGSNVTYTWDFGDSVLATGAIVTHTYSTVGNYTATITATNSVNTLTTTTSVTITALPLWKLYLPLVVR